jgi:hypothetical protein
LQVPLQRALSKGDVEVESPRNVAGRSSRHALQMTARKRACCGAKPSATTSKPEVASAALQIAFSNGTSCARACNTGQPSTGRGVLEVQPQLINVARKDDERPQVQCVGPFLCDRIDMNGAYNLRSLPDHQGNLLRIDLQCARITSHTSSHALHLYSSSVLHEKLEHCKQGCSKLCSRAGHIRRHSSLPCQRDCQQLDTARRRVPIALCLA